MKAMALEYPFNILLAAFIILVAVGIILTVIKLNSTKPPSIITDVRYSCSQLNNTKIGLDDFRLVFYGFLTDQCNNFTATMTQTVTLRDVQRIATDVDSSIRVINVTECVLPYGNSYTVYLCCKQNLEKNEVFNITKREIRNSDVLICED